MIPLEAGQAVTIQTARFAAVLYGAALWSFLHHRSRAYRWIGTLGLLAYLIHVVCAFEFFYQWSHTVAYRETARQTKELFGVAAGAGLYLNYVFTALWTAECALSWTTCGTALLRAPRLLVHTFLGFMVLDGSLVVWLLIK